ncbi:hypothetical protein [Burkholderia territorii]|uniref:hypothetical protein n=2 Tax=Burkholderia territorii TaxID=1503055 RepID=UPI0012D8B2D7|nr:hypothetical protein [Burkholderia territorii]
MQIGLGHWILRLWSHVRCLRGGRITRADAISGRHFRSAPHTMQHEEFMPLRVSARFVRTSDAGFDYENRRRKRGEIRSVRVNPLVRIIVQRMRGALGAMAYRRSDSALQARRRCRYRASAR